MRLNYNRLKTSFLFVLILTFRSKDNVIDNAINFINQDNIITEEPVKLSGKKR